MALAICSVMTSDLNIIGCLSFAQKMSQPAGSLRITLQRRISECPNLAIVAHEYWAQDRKR